VTTKATLKPYLTEIRDWVAQGYTDVWIAHTLNSTPASISSFRSENGILRRDVASEVQGPDVAPPVLPADAEEAAPEVKPKRRRRTTRKAEPEETPVAVVEEDAGDGEGEPRKRRRRGGRGRGKRLHTYEAVLDHGDEGYGFWLDGSVRDDTLFLEHWGSRRALVVKIEADQIVIRPDDRESAPGASA
jgi:hypothetical protein